MARASRLLFPKRLKESKGLNTFGCTKKKQTPCANLRTPKNQKQTRAGHQLAASWPFYQTAPAKNSKYIAYIAPDAKTEEDEKKVKDKNDARVADKDDKHPRVWLLPVESGDPKAITPVNWEIKELAWMPSGQNLVVAATDHPESDQNTDRILGVHVPDGEIIRLASPRGPFGHICVSPNGKTIGYIGAREDGPSPHDLMLLPVENAAARNVF